MAGNPRNPNIKPFSRKRPGDNLGKDAKKNRGGRTGPPANDTPITAKKAKPAGSYKQLQKAAGKKGTQAIERQAYERAAQRRGISVGEAKKAVDWRVSKGLNAGGFQGPNAKQKATPVSQNPGDNLGHDAKRNPNHIPPADPREGPKYPKSDLSGEGGQGGGGRNPNIGPQPPAGDTPPGQTPAYGQLGHDAQRNPNTKPRGGSTAATSIGVAANPVARTVGRIRTSAPGNDRAVSNFATKRFSQPPEAAVGDLTKPKSRRTPVQPNY